MIIISNRHQIIYSFKPFEKQMEWRFIPKEKIDPYFAIALEEALLEEVSKTETPILRFWEWEDEAVTIGRSQKASNEVDLGLCRDENIGVIRRPSGGGAMYHSPGDEIVYSVIAPKDLFPDDITLIYRRICTRLANIFDQIEIKAEFVKPNSIFVREHKISGNAQKITSEDVLQHGTVLYSPDRKTMFSALKDSHTEDRYISSDMNSVTGISELVDISFDDLYQLLKSGLLEGKEHFTEKIRKEELERAKELVEKKYGKEGWNLTP